MRRSFWDLNMSQAELFCLFVFGFTFLITAIDAYYGLSYLLYIFFASLFLFIMKYIKQIREDNKEKKR